jgi:glycosyltransferase involved in cell wall biosynthesis
MSSSSTATTTAPAPQSGRALVSIVIPNFNYGRYLRSAIDSALAQTYSPTEVIVVDDGSTDNSRKIIESYGERIVAILKANGGHGSALNAGYAASRGEIVIFLDADDELMPDAVEQVVKAWRPGVAKAQFQLEMVDETGRPLGERVPPFDRYLPSGDIRELIVRYGEYPSSPCSGNAYSRAALDKLMPMDEILWSVGSEKSLVFLSPFFGDVVSIRAPLGRYRIHSDNDSGFKGRHLEKLHRRLSAVYFIPETICRVAASKGIALDPRVLGSTSRELKIRIASLRLDPKTHPIATDTRLSLLIEGLGASMREPDISLSVRVKQILWFVLMALGPMRLVSSLAAPAR